MKLFSKFLAEEMAKDHGTYAALLPTKECREKLYKWMEEQSIARLVDVEDYHCTIVYSTKSVPTVADIPVALPIKATCKEWKVFGDDKMLVLVLTAPKAQKLFDKTIKLGAVSDYSEYVAHITLALRYRCEVPKEVPDFEIEFVKFKVGTIDEDFSYSDDK